MKEQVIDWLLGYAVHLEYSDKGKMKKCRRTTIVQITQYKDVFENTAIFFSFRNK